MKPDLRVPHSFMAIVGESFHQGELRAILDNGRREGLTATLLHEPDNPYDSNAVAVLISGAIVGHLARDVAKRFHSVVAAAPAAVCCPAKLTGGDEVKPTVGVVLDFAAVYALDKALR